MKPPVCGRCGRRFDPADGGGTVNFADYQPLPLGMTGHPAGCIWFCHRHLSKAETLKAMVARDALAAMSIRHRAFRLLRKLAFFRRPPRP